MPTDQRKLNDGEQGSGSGLDADTVDRKESSDLGNTIDGKTIVENSNGDIQVKPTEVLIGSFKDDNSDGWALTNVDIFFNGVPEWDNSDGFMMIRGRYSNTSSATRTANMDNKTKLMLHYKIDPEERGFEGQSDDKFKIKVGGTTEITINGGSVKEDILEIFLLDYSGNQEISIEQESGSSEFNVGVKDIKIFQGLANSDNDLSGDIS